MSNIVTLEQAVKLKEIGFDRPTLDYFREHDSGLFSEFSTSYAGAQSWNEQQRKVFSRPTVSEALDYLREEKGIACGVSPDYNTKPTGKQFYAGGGFNGNYVTVVYKYVYEFYDNMDELHRKKCRQLTLSPLVPC